jgi:hypothetical protein
MEPNELGFRFMQFFEIMEFLSVMYHFLPVGGGIEKNTKV